MFPAGKVNIESRHRCQSQGCPKNLLIFTLFWIQDYPWHYKHHFPLFYVEIQRFYLVRDPSIRPIILLHGLEDCIIIQLEKKLNITIIASQTFDNLENNANNAWLPTTKLWQRFNFVSLKERVNPFATSLSESRFQNLGQRVWSRESRHHLTIQCNTVLAHLHVPHITLPLQCIQKPYFSSSK